MATNTFLSAAVVAGVLFYGGSLVLSKAMSAGALVSFMLYQQSLSGAFQSLGDVFSALSAAVGAADKVVELIHRRPTIPPAGKLTPSQFFGRIEFCDVGFAYPSRPLATILSQLSLTVEPGEVVALVGPSGGGKSSIVKLVERFYLPTSGSVLIDGRDVGAYEPGWLRRHIGLVSQEPVLYARSIKRNIIYGLETEDGVPESEQPTQTDIEHAARLANAHEFISQLPQGYDTEIMGAPSLSGGQKQRLAIARALVRKPAVLLLDEATSALDADSEAVVQEALDRTMAGRTVLVIAHRLSTVQNASRIMVVQGGNVAEMGTHEELLEKGGAYAALVRRQLARSPSSAAMMSGLGLDRLKTSSSSSLIIQ
jgi:ATP-binding cassette subfamily B (MDR/TAP) protein 9